MATAADICNRALSRVGHTEFIDSLDERTEAGRVCALNYPLTLAAVLAAFPWRFATRRAELAQLVDGERNGWAYAFVLPSDCVRAGPIWNGLDPLTSAIDLAAWEEWQGYAGQVPYELEDDPAAGRILLANQDTVSLSYVSDAVAMSRYPAPFVEAVAWALAGELALAFAKKPQVAQLAQQGYVQALATAKASELNQAQPTTEARPSSISARD